MLSCNGANSNPGRDLIIWILDDAGAPVPIGVPGELYIGGAGVALGYHARPELTNERFVADRFSSEPGARLYRTGDLARWRADGQLQHLGRTDFQVKVRGYRIELGEIEVALAHSQVAEAVVVAQPGPGGEQRLVGYLVVRSQPAPTSAMLRERRRQARGGQRAKLTRGGETTRNRSTQISCARDIFCTATVACVKWPLARSHEIPCYRP
jgi:acyl-coenzyme A synthetase/AMP-(fatty) acid ligase